MRAAIAAEEEQTMRKGSIPFGVFNGFGATSPIQLATERLLLFD